MCAPTTGRVAWMTGRDLRRIVPRFTDGFGTKDLKEAKARLDRENIVFGRADQGAVDHDQPGLKARIRIGVVGAQHLELAYVLRIGPGQLRPELAHARGLRGLHFAAEPG